MFGGASNLAEGVDKAFVIIFAIAFVFIIGITSFMIFTLIRYRRKKIIAAKQFEGSIILEIIWTTIPLIVVLIMFHIGWSGFAPMRKVPAGAMNVQAIGRMWQWEFDYGDGIKSKNLVLPVNKPVRIGLKSEDVNHSLFIPAFRVKEDVIPGYNNYLWFTPTIVGEYEILCTEYCGLLHSAMLAKARILEQSDYDKWFAEAQAEAAVPEPDGYLLLRNTGCIACHSLDGSRLVGPSFKGLFGSERQVSEGDRTISVKADEEYVTASVFEPDKDIASGFPKGVMKSYRELLKDSDIEVIIDYLKTIGVAQ